jgi:hypothetical protein
VCYVCACALSASGIGMMIAKIRANERWEKGQSRGCHVDGTWIYRRPLPHTILSEEKSITKSA